MTSVPKYHGESMAIWIESRREFQKTSDDGIRRVVRHWRSGVDPLETTVDSLLCRLEIHLSEVPAWAILGWPPRSTAGLVTDWRRDGRLDLVRAAA